MNRPPLHQPQVLLDLRERLLANSRPLPAEAQRVLYDNLWGLYVE